MHAAWQALSDAAAALPRSLTTLEYGAGGGHESSKCGGIAEVSAKMETVGAGSRRVRRDAPARRCSERDHPGSVSVPTTCLDDLPPGLGLR